MYTKLPKLTHFYRDIRVIHNFFRMTSKKVDTNLADGILNNNEWVKRWDVKNIGFHQPVHASILDKKESELFGGKTRTIFAPLCGKSMDLKWMYDKGHTVTGIEVAELAIQEFFQEHNIDHDVEEMDIGKLYKSKDGRLKLYAVDLYDVTKERVGDFEVIYDCRSLVAINLEDHKLYRDLMVSLMKKDGMYALMTVEYDENIWPGPPHSINDKTVKDLYGEIFDITILDEIVKDNPNAKKVEDLLDEEKPKSWGAANKLSSFVADRWYCMRYNIFEKNMLENILKLPLYPHSGHRNDKSGWLARRTKSMADRHYEYSNWVDSWSANDIGFHKPAPDTLLDSKKDVIFGEGSKRVFVPLCGKSEDMSWMYSKGHSVVGVDIAEKAASDFFVEHKMEPIVETIENVGKLYKTKDERLQIYSANVIDLTLNRIKKFDVIWDIAGYCVINKEDRSKYANLIQSLMLPTSKYYLMGPDYDKTVFPGPPHPTSIQTLTEYFVYQYVR